ncbi:MAG: hypothetical protein R2828_29720 [Saprospiraceae bacterium]
MKEKIGWFTFGIFVAGSLWQGIIGGLILVLGWASLLIFTWPFLIAWDHKQKLKKYAVQRENIYVYSLYPGDRSVYERAGVHRSLLKESSNQLGVIVHEIYFRDAGFEDEKWEDFPERRDTFILEDTKRRHLKLNSQDRDWFKIHILNQEGLEI